MEDSDRGSQLAAVYIAGCAITFVFVGMRLTARYSIASVGIDDWTMLSTWISFVGLTVLLCLFSFDGGTRHLLYLTQDPEHTKRLLMKNWISQSLAILCLGLGKIAIALLILRLLDRVSSWRRWSLHFINGLTLINTVLMIIFNYVQCENPAALWDDEVKARTKCWAPQVQSSFSTYGASVHAAVDFYLAFLPGTLVWGLKLDMRKKLALCALLGCGSITGICASIKASKLSKLNARSDFTWETFSLFMWTGIEIILLIICGSIPALRPLYSIWMGRSPISVRSSQQPGTGYGKRSTMQRSHDQRVDHGSSVALVNVTPPSQTVVTCDNRSDIEWNNGVSGGEKSSSGIHVQKTVTIS
ncbi:hypothetical protein K458DRAFT_303769 [Lentithecium fluviatile CBS 122367]|uniref:Rhodopsin domain-containing protein n=1 Tax=Lentithecium fluviatile CBS 122367 TaxID=1168545 RepID=A0A6G1J1S1_9PLEO|nr:hypothetical protein K458DRAFT_303769 [Lentithecium fluviatile CBS 122367]